MIVQKKDLMVLYQRNLLKSLGELKFTQFKLRLLKIMGVGLVTLSVIAYLFGPIFYDIFQEIPRINQIKQQLSDFLSSIFFGQLIPLFFASLAITVLLLLYYYFLRKSFRSAYKKSVVEKIVKMIDPEIIYLPDRNMASSHFTASSLFDDVNSYYGDDYVEGTYKGVKYSFSEIHAHRITTDSEGHKHVHHVFDGLFLVSSHSRTNKSTTLIIPEESVFFLSAILRKIIPSAKTSRNGKDVVRLENPNFEKIFEVYSDDQVSARMLLTPVLMEKLIAYRRKYGHNIYLSFKDSTFYLAVSFEDKEIFEPSIFGDIVSFNNVREIFDLLTITISIIDSLNDNP
ncbi:MAG: DUF3137 domain-containing protein [Oligoflexia bacterium]|nr:DUF3137 domain-containing protein [Oligoflexia bacterium]